MVTMLSRPLWSRLILCILAWVLGLAANLPGADVVGGHASAVSHATRTATSSTTVPRTVAFVASTSFSRDATTPVPTTAVIDGYDGHGIPHTAAANSDSTRGLARPRQAFAMDVIGLLPGSVVAAKAEVGGGGQVFTHFTNADGVAGITGAGPLKVGESVGVDSLKFGQGGNNFLATNPGDNFVTDLGLDATPGQLQGIGVFGAKQDYAIQFSQEAALNSVRPVMVRENIFTIQGGCTISGACVVTRLR